MIINKLNFTLKFLSVKSLFVGVFAFLVSFNQICFSGTLEVEEKIALLTLSYEMTVALDELLGNTEVVAQLRTMFNVKDYRDETHRPESDVKKQNQAIPVSIAYGEDEMMCVEETPAVSLSPPPPPPPLPPSASAPAPVALPANQTDLALCASDEIAERNFKILLSFLNDQYKEILSTKSYELVLFNGLIREFSTYIKLIDSKETNTLSALFDGASIENCACALSSYMFFAKDNFREHSQKHLHFNKDCKFCLGRSKSKKSYESSCLSERVIMRSILNDVSAFDELIIILKLSDTMKRLKFEKILKTLNEPSQAAEADVTSTEKTTPDIPLSEFQIRHLKCMLVFAVLSAGKELPKNVTCCNLDSKPRMELEFESQPTKSINFSDIFLGAGFPLPTCDIPVTSETHPLLQKFASQIEERMECEAEAEALAAAS